MQMQTQTPGRKKDGPVTGLWGSRCWGAAAGAAAASVPNHGDMAALLHCSITPLLPTSYIFFLLSFLPVRPHWIDALAQSGYPVTQSNQSFNAAVPIVMLQYSILPGRQLPPRAQRPHRNSAVNTRDTSARGWLAGGMCVDLRRHDSAQRRECPAREGGRVGDW
jgi:hypothetical protein